VNAIITNMNTELSAEAKERVLYVVENAHEQPELVGTLHDALELHVFALSWGMHSHCIKQLLRVIADPRCDKGTALTLYWYRNPHYCYRHFSLGYSPVKNRN